MAKALGTIISISKRHLTGSEIHTGTLDYHDHWSEVDDRLQDHHEHLSPHSEAIANDIVNMATYSAQILHYLKPTNIRKPESVVVVGGMTEAYFYSLRSSCDSIAAMIAYVASDNPGQVSAKSLKSLIDWAAKNPTRVRPAVRSLMTADFDWFFKLRSLRDQLAHHGVSATIHCDGRQFNLWMHSHKEGWKTREPLLPLLADSVTNLLQFSDNAAKAINELCEIPKDRLGSRAVSGVLVHELHELLRVSAAYNQPSP